MPPRHAVAATTNPLLNWPGCLHTGIPFQNFFQSTIIHLGVQRSKQAQETIICLFGQLFFSQNGMTLKNLQNYQNPVKSYCFLEYYQSLFNISLQQQLKPIR